MALERWRHGGIAAVSPQEPFDWPVLISARARAIARHPAAPAVPFAMNLRRVIISVPLQIASNSVLGAAK
jgi:hypothetical protein